MLRLLMLAIVVAFTGLFTACGPIYQSTYTYQSPPTPMEKRCAAHCVQGRNSCLQICDLKNLRCVQRAHEKALNQYQEYKQEQWRKGARITKSLKQFEDRSACRKSCTCTESFNTCYSACGGVVYEHKKCIAFCDKA